MADIFLSYSHKDKPLMRRLHEALTAQGRDVWVDWEDIPLSANWWSEITEGIEAADTFVFLISPDSVISPVCNFEVVHALESGKRIVPIMYREVDQNATFATLETLTLDEGAREILGDRDFMSVSYQSWGALSRHNWLFIKDDATFERNFAQLLKIIDTDLAHVKQHTRFLVRAREWADNDRNSSYLLSGQEAASAKQWRDGVRDKEPQPTPLHDEYIHTSVATQRNRRVLTGTGVGFVAIVTIFLVLLFQQVQIANTAQREAQNALADSEVARNDLQTALDEARKRILAGRLDDIAINDPALAQSLAFDLLTTDDLPLAAYYDAVPATGFAFLQAQYDLTERITEIDYLDDNLVLLTTLSEVLLINLETGELVDMLIEGETIKSVEPSLDEAFLYVSVENGRVRKWDIEANWWVSDWEIAGQGSWDLFNPLFIIDEGNRGLVMQSTHVVVWDTDTGEQLAVLDGHDDFINNLTITEDGTRAMTSSSDGTAILWNLDDYTSISETTFAGVPQSSAISPNGTSAAVAICSADGDMFCSRSELSLVNLETGNIEGSFAGHSDNVLYVAYSPDGDIFVSSSLDDTIIIWDAVTGERLHTITDIETTVSYFAFSPDGRTLNAFVDDGGEWTQYLIRPTLDEVLADLDVAAMSALTCQDRIIYNTPTLCEGDSRD